MLKQTGDGVWSNSRQSKPLEDQHSSMASIFPSETRFVAFRTTKKVRCKRGQTVANVAADEQSGTARSCQSAVRTVGDIDADESPRDVVVLLVVRQLRRQKRTQPAVLLDLADLDATSLGDQQMMSSANASSCSSRILSVFVANLCFDWFLLPFTTEYTATSTVTSDQLPAK